ncbi:50S ribosomal protein L29 [Patescibacteria group bacterium]|nr:50S ribosomal protein L29 [Patescibacteria group bacterium]MBU0776799.1 50S ribosomal protein L29 [Patescibacteria group bacterium]MBU0845626.1 50S ribosomal protein L29 [Patescibacteria group bacterium]MBU0922668.1 50S ribosomal protein L29 [Patescibacteria group bacterium]MBU1066719.1 50S ribosomal protein L29 [Patescibacteria group bacterium]
MKKKDLQELRNKKVVELDKIVAKKKQETIMADAKMKTGQEKKIKKVKNLRREIAQVLTIIREKEILGEKEKKEAKNNTKTK